MECPEDALAIGRIANNFRDAFGNRLSCIGLELVPVDQAPQLAKESLPRACRDAVALSFISAGTRRDCRSGQRIAVFEADYFDAIPIVLRNGRLVVNRPGLRMFGKLDIDCYHPTLRTDIHEPRDTEFVPDGFLLKSFEAAISMLLLGEKETEIRQVLRAVSIALYGCRILRETESILYDLGPRIIAWVSAFETLVHPGNGKVGLDNVLDLIDRIRWHDERLQKKDFPIEGGKSNHNTENAAANFYRRLYGLRNAFAHGNLIDPEKIHARVNGEGGPRIDEVAPLLFRECLLERFRELKVTKPLTNRPSTLKEMKEFMLESLWARNHQKAFAVAIFGKDGADSGNER